MEFCKNCDNKLYIKINNEQDDDTLIHYCMNCGYEEPMNTSNLCVYKTNFKKSSLKYESAINQYTKLDPTLPRINTIKCPKKDCISNTNDDPSNREVIYVRYDDDNLKFVYLCAKCDTVWKTDEQK